MFDADNARRPQWSLSEVLIIEEKWPISTKTMGKVLTEQTVKRLGSEFHTCIQHLFI